MERMSIPRLAEKLNGLAEAFDKKPVSVKALDVWFETLKEFNTEMLLNLLGVWAKNHGKFPVPAEVWKAAAEISSDERERIHERKSAELERSYKAMGQTETGRRALKTVMSGITRKRNPIDHWRNVLATKGLPQATYDFANHCLDKIDPARRQEQREAA